MPTLREPDKSLLKLIAQYIVRSELGEPCEHMVAWMEQYMKDIWEP